MAGTVPEVPPRRTPQRRNFTHRAETFGLDTDIPWAIDALRLVFCAPRVYAPLVDAWELRYPGSRKALDRLVDAGFVDHQPPVMRDLRTKAEVTKTSKRLPRYRTTSKGHRLALAAREDYRFLTDTFERITDPNAMGLAKLLDAFDLDDSHARFGLSAPHAIELSGMADRSGRWWVRKLLDGGWLRELPEALPDHREVVPAHWRLTRILCRQISDVLDAYPQPWGHLRGELRLARSRFLADIDPARIGVSGATDFDHDVTTQRILAQMLRSQAFAEGPFAIEPRLVLPARSFGGPVLFGAPEAHQADAAAEVFYQPDALLTERHDMDGRSVVHRGVLEYERYQSRKDGWAHIERYVGWLHTTCLPFEHTVLRFVVDSESRLRGYVELINAFADYGMEHPERMPANPATLAITSVGRLEGAADALSLRHWFRIALPRPDGQSQPRLHAHEHSPYRDYFGT